MILDFILGARAGGSKILTSEDLARFLEGMFKSSAGVSVTPDRAMRFAAVYASVRVLAESVGQLPLTLFRRRGRERLPATDHPLHSVLHHSPNQYQTAQEWKEWLVACLALHGNGYSQINRVRGTVRELNPMHPDTVTPKVDAKSGELVYAVRQPDGTTEELPPSEVFHVKLFPLDGYIGASPIAYARETIGIGIAAEKHGAGLFANGAQPGGILESDKELSKEAQKRLLDSWEERHAGGDNAHRMAVLEGGLKWKTMTMPSKDAQWLESRKFQRSEIAGIFRVPPHLVGDLERATFSNIEHSSLDFVVHSLMPYLTRIEQRIWLQLLSPAEQKEMFGKFKTAALLRGDMAARAAYYTSQLQNGALSPNEIREFEDLNPREGGDVFLTPMNMLHDGKPPPAPEKKDPAPAPAPPDDDPGEDPDE